MKATKTKGTIGMKVQNASEITDNDSKREDDSNYSSDPNEGATERITGTGASTSTSSHMEDAGASKEAIQNRISQKETKAVHIQKVIVLLIMVVAAVSICFLVFTITKRSEEYDYNTQFGGAAQQLITVFETMMLKVSSISSIGVVATTYGLDQTESRWPFILVSSFQQRSSTSRVVSGALMVSLDPYVTDDDRPKYEPWATEHGKIWMREAIAYQKRMNQSEFDKTEKDPDYLLSFPNGTVKYIHYHDVNDVQHTDPGPGPYLVSWSASPYVKVYDINENALNDPRLASYAKTCVDNDTVVVGGIETAPYGSVDSNNSKTSLFATLYSFMENKAVPYISDPIARIWLPVYDSFASNRKVVAVTQAIFSWRYYFTNRLPETIQGITIVLTNSCDGSYTYEVNGNDVQVMGLGDLHDKNFAAYDAVGSFDNQDKIEDGSEYGLPCNYDTCEYSLMVYPSQKFYNTYQTSTPFVVTFAVALVFAFTIGMFLMYDQLVERRQKVVLRKAEQSTAIVTSMFPKQVCDRLLDDTNEKNKVKKTLSGANQLKSYLSGDDDGFGTSNQMADLFPHCTVLFADICGFTAWSSSRQPDQVFQLLQTIYNNFDRIAKRRNVFKVETIGDCYVAVTGLPEPQSNHAMIMGRFAYECRQKIRELVRELSVTLGPGTSDLTMRFGMHSGPVTAGILGGDRARFQLFGDSVNTAARIESTGAPDKIHISQSTADQLIAVGKSHWIVPRIDVVKAKGLGTLKTFWLNIAAKKATSTGSSQEDQTSNDRTHSSASGDIDASSDGQLVKWVVELLLSHIKNMKAKRRQMNNGEMECSQVLTFVSEPGATCLDEVQDVIRLAECGYIETSTEVNQLEPDDDLIKDLHEYITVIAEMYHGQNPFHNFEHACHVTLSVSKLLKRIISPELPQEVVSAIATNQEDYDKYLHQCTYGISSDPLAQFAIVFSALIHDVDHRGCSNVQLAKEESELGLMYRNKSIAEQNSLDLSWNLLMSQRFDRLRSALFETNQELRRFRQFLVNVVLATDIFDKELNDRRKNRWTKAFSESISFDDDLSHRRATIVIEHIIQASDVSHTMQHWQVYRKWNRLLFHEMHEAYSNGRMSSNPAEFWYKGEVSFFDGYVIPLAKKLKDCNVFGVSSDEYLNYAVCNRAEWEEKGEQIVEEWIAELNC